MPMMRRGPLDRYPADWVLRQASESQAAGSIEFNGPQPLTVYLHGGTVTHVATGLPGEDDHHGARAADAIHEPAARAHAVDLLAVALGTTSGWYFHDPVGNLDDPGPWRWDIASLVDEARRRAHEARSLGSWAAQAIGLQPASSSTGVVLAPDAWAVVVAMATPATATALREQLGWEPDRLIAALQELVSQGAVAAPPAVSAAVLEESIGGGSAATASADSPDRPRLRAPAGWEPAAPLRAVPAVGETRRHEPSPSVSPSASPPPGPEAPSSAPARSAVASAVATRPVAAETATPSPAHGGSPAVVPEALAAQTREPAPTPPPDPTDDRKSALRRLISNLRSS